MHNKNKLDQFSWPHKRALKGHQRIRTPFWCFALGGMFSSGFIPGLSWLIEKSIKSYLHKIKVGKETNLDVSNCRFSKLPYTVFYSSYTRKKVTSIVNKYCKDFNIKTIFSPFKLSSLLSSKDFIPEPLKSPVVYQFSCGGLWSSLHWGNP